MIPDVVTYRFSIAQITKMLAENLNIDLRKIKVRFQIDQCGDERSPTTQVTSINVEVDNRETNKVSLPLTEMDAYATPPNKEWLKDTNWDERHH